MNTHPTFVFSSTFMLITFGVLAATALIVPILAHGQTSSPTCPALTTTLALGSKGEEVRALQQFLKDRFYYEYPEITGFYGSATENAVSQLQIYEGIATAGSEGYGGVGPRTRAVITALCNNTTPTTTTPLTVPSITITRPLVMGSKGNDVSFLQHVLQKTGFYKYPIITGFFGPFTEAAVVAYQAARGIEALGFVGPLTRKAINSERGIAQSPTTPASPSATTSPSSATTTPPTTIRDPFSSTGAPGNGYTPGFGGGGSRQSDNDEDDDDTPADTTAPVISLLSEGTPNTSSTTVTWTTDEPSTSRVEYGTSTTYFASTTLDSTLTTSHSVIVNNLIASTTYHFRVMSVDSSGNGATSSDDTLLTDAYAAGTKVVTLGDSIMQFEHGATASSNPSFSATIENQADGELTWTRWRSPRFRHEIWYDSTNTVANDRMGTYGDTNGTATGEILFSGANLGYAGDTATGVLQRLTATINTTADVVVYNAGTNIGNTDNAVASTTDSIEEAVSTLKAAGKGVILGTIRPRRVAVSPSGTQISPASMDRIVLINDWIRSNAGRLGATLWDPWEDLRDPAYGVDDDLYGTDLTGVTRDNVHLAPYGAWLSSRTLSIALNSIIEEDEWFDTNPDTDNIFSNGEFAGTGGTPNFGISGSVPSNLTIVNTRSIASPHVTASSTLEANADTGGQSIVLNATSTGLGTSTTHIETIRISTSPNPTTGFTSTDYVSALWEVEIIGQGEDLIGSFQATLGQSSSISARGMGQVTTDRSSQPYPTPADGVSSRGWIATEPLLVGSRSSLNPRLDFDIRDDIAGNIRVKVHRMILRVVTDPSTLFPWDPD